MRTLAVLDSARGAGTGAVVVPISGRPVAFGVVEAPDPEFDPGEKRSHVLVRVRAFSLNYRDRALALRASAEGSARVVGSEFAGDVVAVGGDLTDLAVGDRVISDASWPHGGAPGVIGGVPTDFGSAELLVLPRSRLMRTPASMSPEVGAAFTIGAQTTYSMIRRLGLRDGESVLVLSARSNTSLFALEALRALPVTVYAMTTDERHAARIASLGAGVFVVPRDLPDFRTDVEIARVASRIGGFDAAIDPFADLHAGRVVDILGFGGRYITCGFYAQHVDVTGEPPPPLGRSGGAFIFTMMVRNLALLGNCLGTTKDLERALVDWESGRLGVPMDRVFDATDVGGFMHRTWNDPDRFGKVVARWA